MTDSAAYKKSVVNYEYQQPGLTVSSIRFSELSLLAETSIFATQHLYRPGTKSQSIISQNGHPFA
jgi:hypothetical protein